MSPRAPHRKPLFEVRHSRIHGYGVFALRRIRKGTTVIEYLGDRVTHDLANERYKDKDPKDGHTFLFTVDAKTVIDAGVNGNEARFVNHGCHPNCQTVNTGRRIFIEALRTIQPGEELAYDYQIQRDDDDPADVDVIFACHCGAQSCRGSMLEAPKKKRRPRRPSPKRKVARQAARKSGRKVVRKSGRKVVGKGGRKVARQGARKRPR
ncbi:MAG TPA: SET domain-containing protein-lysine N-methyltransferase [Steroidobacteraceae bacterium]|nr:SET domain-containing protein-lysine N-methyltransferase [Steroidobacteraceae bacterium]